MTIFSVGHSTHEPEAFLPLMRGVEVLIDVRSHPTSRWEWWRRENMGWVEEAGHQLIWEPRLGGWTAQHMPNYGETMAAVGVNVAAYSKGAFPKQQIGVKLGEGIDPTCPVHGSSKRPASAAPPPAEEPTAAQRILSHMRANRGATLTKEGISLPSPLPSLPFEGSCCGSTPTPTCSCSEYASSPQWTNRGLRDYSWFETTADFHDGLAWLYETYGRDDQPNAAIMCAEALWWKCHRSMVADALIKIHDCDTGHLKPSLPKRATTCRFTSHRASLGNRLERYEPGIWESFEVVR